MGLSYNLCWDTFIWSCVVSLIFVPEINLRKLLKENSALIDRLWFRIALYLFNAFYYLFLLVVCVSGFQVGFWRMFGALIDMVSYDGFVDFAVLLLCFTPFTACMRIYSPKGRSGKSVESLDDGRVFEDKRALENLGGGLES